MRIDRSRLQIHPQRIQQESQWQQIVSENKTTVILVIIIIILLILNLGLSKQNQQHTSEDKQIEIQGDRQYQFDYIKYPKQIYNITEFNQNIKDQINDAMGELQLKDIYLLELLGSKNMNELFQEETIRKLLKKMEEQDGLQHILQTKQEDSSQICEQIQMEKSFYEECRSEVLRMLNDLEKEQKPKQVLKKLTDLDGQVKQLVEKSAAIYRQRQNVHQDYKDKIKKIENQIYEYTYQNKYNRNNQDRVQDLEKKNKELKLRIRTIQDQLANLNKRKVNNREQIDENNNRINELNQQIPKLQEKLIYIELQIEEKKLVINLPRIMKEMNVDQKQQFADKVKQRLIILQKMYYHDQVNESNKVQLRQNIKNLQKQFQETMELVNHMKRTAFNQYQKNYETYIRSKEDERDRLKNQLNTLQYEVQSLQFKNKDLQDESRVNEHDTRVEMNIKLENLEREFDSNKKMIEQFDQISGDHESDIQVQQRLLESVKTEYQQHINQVTDKLKQIKISQKKIENDKEETLTKLKQIQDSSIEVIKILNQKLYDCKLKEKYLKNIFMNGLNYMTEIERFKASLVALQREVDEMLEDLKLH